MRKKRVRPGDVRPTRGSVHSVAHLRDLDREITRKQSEIGAAKAAARKARLQTNAKVADGAIREEKRPADAAPEANAPALPGLGPELVSADAAPEANTAALPGLGPELGPGDAVREDSAKADGATREEKGPADAAPEDDAAEMLGLGPELSLAARLQTRGAPLVVALEHHLRGAREHAEATASYAFATAVEVGFGRARSEALREAAMLHEVGQLYVPAATLAEAESERDEAGTEAFEALYEAGYWVARRAGIPEHVCGWLLRVRERYDGAGPEGLAGDAIPIESRIIRAACVCQTALAEPVGPGQQPRSRAVEQLNARAGGQLDPQVVAALVTLIERASATG